MANLGGDVNLHAKWVVAVLLALLVFVAAWVVLQEGIGLPIADALGLSAIPFSLVFGFTSAWANRVSPIYDQESDLIIPRRPCSANSVNQIRDQRGLRKIEKIEEGLTAAELPSRVYGFCVPGDIDPSADTFGEGLSISRKRGPNILEVHRLKEGANDVVVYVAGDEAVRLCNPSRGHPCDLTVSVTPTSTKSRPVSIPINLIYRWRERQTSDGSVADVVVGMAKML